MNEYCRKLRDLYNDKRIGITFSCFDLLHAGHVNMLEDAKRYCDILIVGLQSDPTIDRPGKNKPIMSLRERKIMINAIKWVDEIIEYNTENDVKVILKSLNPDIRILGSDYLHKDFTGSDLDIPIYYHDRSIHRYSTTNLRKRVYNAEKELR